MSQHPQVSPIVAIPKATPIAVPPQPAPGLIARTQRFVEDNQKAILIGAAVAVGAGAGYYLYTRSQSSPGGSSSSKGPAGAAPGSSKKNKKSKKKKNGGGGQFLQGEGNQGPLLEEIKPAESAEKKVPAPAPEDPDAALNDVPDAAALEEMSDEARNALGAELKGKGNKLFTKKEYKKAVEYYTKAIEVSVKPDAVFYSNRAACYMNYSPAEYEKVVADCDEALKLDRNYAKALKRRANALEHLDRMEEAICDLTATTIIDGFKDEQTMTTVDRYLSDFAAKKAKEILQTREPRLPSPTFIASYLAAFRPRDKPATPENPSQGDETLSLAFDALEAVDYIHANSLVNEAIEQGISTKQGQAEAYNLRGTFKFLIGDSEAAKEDLEKALDLVPEFVQAWVKIASVHMELGDPVSAFGDFEAAIRYNPEDPDIYYHRGQVHFIMQDFDKAIADYNKSTELDNTFIFTHVQQAVAQYKLNNKAASMAAFRRILKQFPDRGEPSTYYGEILLDSEKYDESVSRFDRAMELDKDKRPRNALPLVNKAIAVFQWKQDIAEAESLCKQALEIDADCDVAVVTLAQFSLQQGKIEEAIKWFGEAARLARTEAELVNAIKYEYASRAQKTFIENYPEYAQRLSQMAPA